MAIWKRGCLTGAAVLVLIVLWIIPYLRTLTRASQTMVYEATGLTARYGGKS